MNKREENNFVRTHRLQPKKRSESEHKSDGKTKFTDISSSQLLSSVSSKLNPKSIEISTESRISNIYFENQQMKINCIGQFTIPGFSLKPNINSLDFQELRREGVQKKLKNWFSKPLCQQKSKKLCSSHNCPIKIRWKDQIVLFEKQMLEAKKLRQRTSQLSKHYCDQIQKDSIRSFPLSMLPKTKITLYHTNSQKTNIVENLKTVLKMLVLLDEEVGYVQGMNLYVATIISHMKEVESCFVFVKQIMKYGNFRTMYIRDFKGLKQKTQELLHRHIKILMRDLYDHLIVSEVEHQFFMPFYLSMFACVIQYCYMPIVIDQFLTGGFPFLQKLILSLLCYIKNQLLQAECEQVTLRLGVSHIKSLNLPWQQIINLTQAIKLN